MVSSPPAVSLCRTSAVHNFRRCLLALEQSLATTRPCWYLEKTDEEDRDLACIICRVSCLNPFSSYLVPYLCLMLKILYKNIGIHFWLLDIEILCVVWGFSFIYYVIFFPVRLTAVAPKEAREDNAKVKFTYTIPMAIIKNGTAIRKLGRWSSGLWGLVAYNTTRHYRPEDISPNVHSLENHKTSNYVL